jgi:hypothetical protein
MLHAYRHEHPSDFAAAQKTCTARSDVMRSILVVCLAVTTLVLACSSTEEKGSKEAQADRSASTSMETATMEAKCEHGVDKALCTRCDPRLEAVFKAKGDWCPEHSRPETQCAICHPELAAAGVK